MKKALVILGAALMLFSMAGCQKGSGELEVWSFTDELGIMINDYYLKDNPDAKVNFSLTPTEQFPSRLDPVLSSGRGAPDVFALEAAFVRKYVEEGPQYMLDLTDVYEKNKDKLIPYPVEIGMQDGKVYALSWQVAPGALFYRRSLAKKYLGTDDPAEVQKYFTDFSKFIETAKLLKDKSNGACVVVSGPGDLQFPFLGIRKQPWVVNGRLVIDPVLDQYFDIAKTMYDNRWDGRVGQWSEGWFAGMRGELKDESGKDLEVFSYFLPTWGLHYVLKTNAPNTSGDWAMTQGPAAFRWGGTWIGAFKGTKKAELAKSFIEYLTCSDGFEMQWAKNTGDVVGNLNVTNAIKDTYSEPYLGGQNHYAAFVEMAKNVDGKLVQATDDVIQALFSEAITAYSMGEKTKEQAIADFRQQVSSQVGIQ